MSIVKLNGNLIRELGPGSFRLLEPPNDVKQRGSTPEVLLFQTQFFASLKVIIGVENS